MEIMTKFKVTVEYKSKQIAKSLFIRFPEITRNIKSQVEIRILQYLTMKK